MVTTFFKKDDKLNPNKKRKFEKSYILSDAFSNAYISKQLDNSLCVVFTIDYLRLVQQLSGLPDDIRI